MRYNTYRLFLTVSTGATHSTVTLTARVHDRRGGHPPMQYVIGKPNPHKTDYLIGLFLQQGGAYFDFTGDLSPLLSRIPPSEYDNTVLFRPLDIEYPIGLNIIHHPDNIPRVSNAVLETIKSAWHYEGSTPLLDMYTYNSTASLCHVPDATLLGIPFLLNDIDYQAKVIGHLLDPVLLYFWHDFYAKIPERDKRHDTMSTLNKVFALITDPTVRNIIGQKKTTFTVSDMSFIIASFPRELGKEKASFLATLLLYYLPDIPVVIDGGHNLGPKAVLEKENVTFAHSYLQQLTESTRETLIGTADEIVCFRIGPSDNLRLEREFDLNRNVSTLTELAYNRYHVKGQHVTHDVKVRELPEALYDPEKLIRYNREKNCTPREHVECSISKFFN